jgi:hypothetical protein
VGKCLISTKFLQTLDDDHSTKAGPSVLSSLRNQRLLADKDTSSLTLLITNTVCEIPIESEELISAYFIIKRVGHISFGGESGEVQ